MRASREAEKQAQHTNNKLDGEIEIPIYYKLRKEISSNSDNEAKNALKQIIEGDLRKLEEEGFVDVNEDVKEEELEGSKKYFYIIVKSFKISTKSENVFQELVEQRKYDIQILDFCDYTINFCASLHMVGEKLQAEKVPMYELVDVIKAPLVNGKRVRYFITNPR